VDCSGGELFCGGEKEVAYHTPPGRPLSTFITLSVGERVECDGERALSLTRRRNQNTKSPRSSYHKKMTCRWRLGGTCDALGSVDLAASPLSRRVPGGRSLQLSSLPPGRLPPLYPPSTSSSLLIPSRLRHPSLVYCARPGPGQGHHDLGACSDPPRQALTRRHSSSSTRRAR
jgi:hypothetical protein